jgi:uncharacterized protein involved in response to NO
VIAINRLGQAPLWDLAFRSFFILASFASVFSLVVWLVYLNSGTVLTSQQLLSPVLWHIHEMFFAFTLTIAVGFLLTAVQTWTGLKSLQGLSLIGLTVIWIVIRGLLLLNQATIPGLLILVLVLQTLWWAVVLVSFSRLLIKAGSKRNYIFIPLLTTLMLLQLSFLYLSQESIDTALHLARSAILVFSIMVGLITGRVIPLFTRNALAVKFRGKIKSTPRVDKTLIIFSLIGSVNFLLSYFVEMPFSPAWALLLVGVLHLVRLTHWASIHTLNKPLLWSLHLSYFCLAIGLILIAISFFTVQVRIADAFHVITVGVFGGMILAMISRVSLGHTGRVLQINKWMVLAFFSLFTAVILRVLLALLNQPLWAWNSSALLWILAYSIFLIFYIPVLAGAKK